MRSRPSRARPWRRTPRADRPTGHPDDPPDRTAGRFVFLACHGGIRTLVRDVGTGRHHDPRRTGVPAGGVVLACPERHARVASGKETGVRLDGSLRQVHGSRAQGPDPGSGRGAAVQPQLHRHGAPAPGPRPRGRGCCRARPREHERRAGQGPDRRRVHHRPWRSAGRRRGRPDAARQAGHRAGHRRGPPPGPQLHRHGAPAPRPRPRGRGDRRRRPRVARASTSTRSATRSSASCRRARPPGPTPGGQAGQQDADRRPARAST